MIGPIEVGQLALVALDADLCPMPPRIDGSKTPIGQWKKYQQQRPSIKEIQAWYGPNTGIGLVCEAPSPISLHSQAYLLYHVNPEDGTCAIAWKRAA